MCRSRGPGRDSRGMVLGPNRAIDLVLIGPFLSLGTSLLRPACYQAIGQAREYGAHVRWPLDPCVRTRNANSRSLEGATGRFESPDQRLGYLTSRHVGLVTASHSRARLVTAEHMDRLPAIWVSNCRRRGALTGRWQGGPARPRVGGRIVGLDGGNRLAEA